MSDDWHLGDTRDTDSYGAGRDRPPKSAIGLFYYHFGQRIRHTHFCKECARWHGWLCFFDPNTWPTVNAEDTEEAIALFAELEKQG